MDDQNPVPTHRRFSAREIMRQPEFRTVTVKKSMTGSNNIVNNINNNIDNNINNKNTNDSNSCRIHNSRKRIGTSVHFCLGKNTFTTSNGSDGTGVTTKQDNKPANFDPESKSRRHCDVHDKKSESYSGGKRTGHNWKSTTVEERENSSKNEEQEESSTTIIVKDDSSMGISAVLKPKYRGKTIDDSHFKTSGGNDHDEGKTSSRLVCHHVIAHRREVPASLDEEEKRGITYNPQQTGRRGRAGAAVASSQRFRKSYKKGNGDTLIERVFSLSNDGRTSQPGCDCDDGCGTVPTTHYNNVPVLHIGSMMVDVGSTATQSAYRAETAHTNNITKDNIDDIKSHPENYPHPNHSVYHSNSTPKHKDNGNNDSCEAGANSNSNTEGVHGRGHGSESCSVSVSVIDDGPAGRGQEGDTFIQQNYFKGRHYKGGELVPFSPPLPGERQDEDPARQKTTSGGSGRTVADTKGERKERIQMREELLGMSKSGHEEKTCSGSDEGSNDPVGHCQRRELTILPSEKGNLLPGDFSADSPCITSTCRDILNIESGMDNTTTNAQIPDSTSSVRPGSATPECGLSIPRSEPTKRHSRTAFQRHVKRVMNAIRIEKDQNSGTELLARQSSTDGHHKYDAKLEKSGIYLRSRGRTFTRASQYMQGPKTSGLHQLNVHYSQTNSCHNDKIIFTHLLKSAHIKNAVIAEGVYSMERRLYNRRQDTRRSTTFYDNTVQIQAHATSPPQGKSASASTMQESVEHGPSPLPGERHSRNEDIPRPKTTSGGSGRTVADKKRERKERIQKKEDFLGMGYVPRCSSLPAVGAGDIEAMLRSCRYLRVHPHRQAWLYDNEEQACCQG